MKRLLVTGGSGMLASALRLVARERNYVVLALPRFLLPIEDRSTLRWWIDCFRPDVVVNCAAYTKVDQCEKDRDLCLKVNGSAVGILAETLRERGIKLIHISSDYVFDGSKRSPYVETDIPNPLSVYGESKLLGEKEALKVEGNLVVRTSWLFGPYGKNFVFTMLRLLRDGAEPLRVVDDQVGTPTYTLFLAKAILELTEQNVSGIVNYANRPSVSWYSFAKEIKEFAGLTRRLIPATTEEVKRPARRPAFSALSTVKFERLVGRKVESWKLGLADLLLRRWE